MDTQRVALTVGGMTCDHCAATVRRALAAVPGVEQADVSFADKRADISANGIAPGARTVLWVRTCSPPRQAK
ncbi:MAG: hypothetical protein GEU99_07825 [Luteitalea sp.]|nr:hypothetical protein [Luteitalea sp.]